MSETWLKPHIPDNFVSLSGYQLLKHDREGREREVGLYVRNGMGARILASSSGHTALNPNIFLSISPAKSRPLLFSVIYRPPKLGHISAFQADFERLHPSFSAAVIIGDFNIDLNRSSHDTDNLINFCSSNHLFIIPYQDTHFTSSSHTCIDHCLLSDQSLIISHHQQPLPFLSSYDLIEVTLDFIVH